MAFFHAVLGIFVLGGIVLLPVLLPIAATARGALKANDSTSKGSFNDLDKKRARGCGRFFCIGLHRYFEQLVDTLDASHPLLSVLRMPQLQRLLHSGGDLAATPYDKIWRKHLGFRSHSLAEDEDFNYRFNSISFKGKEGWIVGKPAILLY